MVIFVGADKNGKFGNPNQILGQNASLRILFYWSNMLLLNSHPKSKFFFEINDFFCRHRNLVTLSIQKKINKTYYIQDERTWTNSIHDEFAWQIHLRGENNGRNCRNLILRLFAWDHRFHSILLLWDRPRSWKNSTKIFEKVFNIDSIEKSRSWCQVRSKKDQVIECLDFIPIKNRSSDRKWKLMVRFFWNFTLNILPFRLSKNWFIQFFWNILLSWKHDDNLALKIK